MNVRLWVGGEPAMVHAGIVDDVNFIWTCCGELFYRKALKTTIVRVVLPTTCLWCISNESVR